MFEEDEIRATHHEEQKATRRKAKPEKIDQKLLAQVRRAFRSGTEREFMHALRKAGISDESPKFGELVKLFRESRGPSA
jgi:hypothetical protein